MNIPSRKDGHGFLFSLPGRRVVVVVGCFSRTSWLESAYRGVFLFELYRSVLLVVERLRDGSERERGVLGRGTGGGDKVLGCLAAVRRWNRMNSICEEEEEGSRSCPGYQRGILFFLL